MATKCPKCHTENPDTQSFCGNCGTQLIPSEAQEVSFTKTLLTPIEDLAQGTLFAGRYEIIEELGKGGMGKVYKVLDNEIQVEVALKLLKPEIASDEKIIERFRNELKIAREIAHKNVCKVFHFGKEKQSPYITMEYVRGEDLKSLIERKGVLTKEEALGVAKQVCSGLKEAHELGVVHRDLKPQNIMIDESGGVKIMDFGIARSVETEGFTEAGMIIGTPDYISPEQAEGKKADQRSDIYSLGVVLYEMVTGRVPFEGDTAFSIALKHKSQLPLHPKKLNPEVSDDLSRLILICMEKDRARRYQTAEALLDDLRNIEEGLPLGTKIKPRRTTLTQTFIRRKFFIPVVAVVLLIIATAIWRLLPHGEAVIAPKIENSIAIISFENQTGDEAFDNLQKVIPNLLITNLENTGFLHVATWERMRDLLKQMNKGDVDIITSDLGFQACQREGIQALALGSFAKVGETFVTDVKLLDVESKRLLKSASSRGEGEDSIFTQIDELSRKISEGMGLSRQNIEAAQLNVSGITTDSLEAYQYYQKGLENYARLEWQSAETNFQKAVDIDSSFAMGYYYLAWVHARHGMILNNPFRDPTPWKTSMALAKKYSQKATDRERLQIEIGTALFNYDYKSVKRLSQRMVEKYPKEKFGYEMLGVCYRLEQDFEKARDMVEKRLELDPTDAGAYWALAYTNAVLKDRTGTASAAKKYIAVHPDVTNAYHSAWEVHAMLGLYDEGQSFLDEGFQRIPEWSFSHSYSGINYLLKKDTEKARKKFRIYLDLRPKDIYNYAFLMACSYLLEGKYQMAVSEIGKIVESTHKADNKGREMVFRIHLGRILLAQRKYDEAIDEFNDAEKLSKTLYDENFNPYSLFANHLIGSALVSKKDYKAAQVRADLIQSRIQIGNYTHSLHSIFYHLLQAELFVAQKRPEAAQEELSKLQQWNVFQEFPRQMKLVAVIEGMRGNFGKAAEVVQNSFKNCGVLSSSVLWTDSLDFIEEYSKLDYNLAKIYEQMGEATKATAHYNKFLDLWKDADPGIPEFEDALARLSALK
jgi:serine/threonine protein kinase